VKESYFGLEVQKDCFAGRTMIENLADGTAHKQQ